MTDAHDTISRKAALAKITEHSDVARKKMAALDVQPAPLTPDWIDNCAVCGRIVDTREKAEGGDGRSCQYGDKWACSSECAEVLSPDPDWLRDALAAPEVSAVQPAPDVAAVDLAMLRKEHAEWSQAQFGDVSAIGPAKHLAKEAIEVAADPTDAIEHADCWMLLWDMQRRAGITDDQLAEAIKTKLAINKARIWPAPKEGEAREHDRALIPTPAPSPDVAALVAAVQQPQCLRTCTTDGGPNTKGQRWVHEADYFDLKAKSDALCAALARRGGDA